MAFWLFLFTPACAIIVLNWGGGNWEVGRVRFTVAYSNTPKHKCNKGMALVAKVLLIFMYLALKSNSVHAGL